MEFTKNKIILILVSAIVLFVIVNINSCNSLKVKAMSLDREVSLRMGLEEKILNLQKEITSLKEVLDKTNRNFEGTKKLLADQQLLNDSLKEQLQKARDAKEALENNLTSSKASKKR